MLVIGSAGGQETKAALAYNAKHVDGIELVGKVVELGKTKIRRLQWKYHERPRAPIFVRAKDEVIYALLIKNTTLFKLTVITTSSSIAAGSGAMQSAYLQDR